MDSPKHIFNEIVLQLSLLKTLEEDYQGKIKGTVYYKRVNSITNRLRQLKNKLEGIGKQTLKVYYGELDNGNQFDFIFDGNIPENEVIQYIEFLSKTKVKWYHIKSIIKTGEINFHKKN